ncbi:MAG: AMP-binding protein [Pseudomonadota bacterium]
MAFQWPRSFCFIGQSSPEGERAAPAHVAAYARQVARDLEAAGIGRGDRVALWLSHGMDQVAAMLGCWQVGAAFCVLPSFAGRTGSDRAKERTDEVLSVLQPHLLIDGGAAALPTSVSEGIGTLTLQGPGTLPDGGAADSAAPPPLGADGDLAFIQFTSGSTGGTPKGAEVRFGQLRANLDALAARSGMTADDRMVSWAPLYHDMGLMAVLLSLRCGADLALMETDHFVRRSSAWLEAISRHKGTVTTGPPTALKLLTRRRARDVDLGTLRYAWIGGEAVFPMILKAFEEAYAEAGLKPGVMQPTYGMAETVVGISCGDPGAAWHVEQGIISCGRILDGMDVSIADEAGAPCADGVEGRVLVKGPSVISGYLGLEPFDPDGWLDTGDLGFLSGGRLYISGRVKDVLKRGAESFPAALVETIAESTLALRTGRVAAFANLRPDLGKEEIVLLVEAREWSNDHARRVASAVLGEVGLQVDVIRPAEGGRLPRTSSGKLMRPLTAAQYREGKI